MVYTLTLDSKRFQGLRQKVEIKSSELSELKNLTRKLLPISETRTELIYRDEKESSQIAETKSDLITINDELISVCP
jgi:hypothetical protein